MRSELAMNKDCIFCKIANRQIKTEIVYENDSVLAFKDLNPQAPVHLLIIPKTHIEKISDLNQGNKNLAAELVMAANEIAVKYKISETGYRLVFNCGPDAGQAVFHIHLHLLGARTPIWPPG